MGETEEVMDKSRRGFIQRVMAGIAATPAIAAAESLTGKTPSNSDQIYVKRWERNGIKFAEYTMPVGVPPFFKREGDTSPRYMMLPPFDWEAAEKRGQSRADLVAACIETHRKYDRPLNLPEVDGIVGSVSRFPEAGHFHAKLITETVPNTHVTIVRVHGREHVMAIASTSYPLVPRTDYYDVKRTPDCQQGEMAEKDKDSLIPPTVSAESVAELRRHMRKNDVQS